MSLKQERKKLSTLVDNRLAFNSEHVQLCVYDTYKECERVPFQAEQLMFCAMHSGKKVMHHTCLEDGQEFLPGQSFLIAGGEKVEIEIKSNKKIPDSVVLNLKPSQESTKQRDSLELNFISSPNEKGSYIFRCQNCIKIIRIKLLCPLKIFGILGV